MEYETYGTASKQWADVHLHCDADYRLVADAVSSKLAYWGLAPE